MRKIKEFIKIYKRMPVYITAILIALWIFIREFVKLFF